MIFFLKSRMIIPPISTYPSSQTPPNPGLVQVVPVATYNELVENTSSVSLNFVNDDRGIGAGIADHKPNLHFGHSGKLDTVHVRHLQTHVPSSQTCQTRHEGLVSEGDCGDG